MIVYVIHSPGGVEGVWTTPEAALKARGKSGSRARIIVRGTDLTEDSDEVKAARLELRNIREKVRDRELAVLPTCALDKPGDLLVSHRAATASHQP